MEVSKTLETLLLRLQQVFRIWYYLLPTLFGLFMILWGIFINGGDWILAGAGLLVFLLFGHGLYRAITGQGID